MTEMPQLKASEVASAVATCIRARRVPFLWGQPGIYKSSVVYQVAADLGMDLIELRAADRDQVDLRGVPYVVDGRTKWAVPDEFPTRGKGVLFIDEFCQADVRVQNVFSQLILDRRVDGYTLPDGWSIVGASNRLEDRAGTTQMPTHLRNRLVHIHCTV